MNTKQRTAMIFVLLLSLVISSCAPGQIFGPTATPTPTNTPMATNTPTETLTPTVAPSIYLSSCSSCQSSGRIEGDLLQEATSVKIGGTITLSPESYLTATPIATATPAAESKTEVKIDNNTHFVFTDVTPGNYYLDVALNLNPCFLGAPGEVFNGAASYFFDNWGALGLSFKDGSSLVTGDTNVFNVYAGKTVNIKLDLPQCYNP